jgi:DNA-directed RNA polymerase specialized sigma subunit
MKDQKLVDFRVFVGKMDSILKENEKEIGKSQRQLLNDLFSVEKQFKALLLKSKEGEKVYEDFINFILEEKENTLSCRPYFRERQDTFTKRIFNLFKKKDSKRLQKYKINYKFMKWAIEKYTGKNKRSMRKLIKEAEHIRKTLCENNLPLVLNKVRMFWSKTPQKHLDYMDLVQTSTEGLLIAIDNFVPPYNTVFRSVAIGRMTLNMMEDYNDTMVKLSPKDKRILYRANKAKNIKENVSKTELTDFVNESFKGVSSEDIENLQKATTEIVDLYSPSSSGLAPVEQIADKNSIEDIVEKTQLKERLMYLMKNLTLLESKVLLLKHGEFEGL